MWITPIIKLTATKTPPENGGVSFVIYPADVASPTSYHLAPLNDRIEVYSLRQDAIPHSAFRIPNYPDYYQSKDDTSIERS